MAELEDHPIVLKVENGTVRSDGKRLCDSCSLGAVVRGSVSEEFVFCSRFERPVPFKVTNCTAYRDRCAPSLYDMEQTAWRVVSDQKNVCGFVSPQEFARIERKQRERN